MTEFALFLTMVLVVALVVALIYTCLAFMLYVGVQYIKHIWGGRHEHNRR